MSRFHDAASSRGFLAALLCAAVLALSACGGGSGTPAGDSPPPIGGGDPPPGGGEPPPPGGELPPAAWQPAEAAFTASIESSEAAVTALDGSGNGFALWLQSPGGNEAGLLASRYVPGTGWSAPQGISLPGVTVGDPKIVVDAQGNAVAVWSQGPTLENQTLFGARFTPAGGWSAPVDIAGTQGAVSRVNLGIDAQGNAIAVWSEQYPAGGGQWTDVAIYGARFTPAGGWSGSNFYADGSSRRPSNLKLAVAPNGDAVLLYSTLTGGGRLRAVNFDGSDWTGDTEVDADGSNAAYEDLYLRVLDDRRAVAGWRLVKTVGDDTQVRVALRDDETLWSDPERLDDDSGAVSEVNFAMDDAGGALAVWVSSDNNGWVNRLVSRRLAPGAAAWGAAQFIDADDRPNPDTTGGDDVSLTMAGARAVVAWRQTTSGGFDIKARVFQAEAWSEAKTLDTLATLPRNPSAAGNAKGQAMVVWKQGNALPLDLWSSFFK